MEDIYSQYTTGKAPHEYREFEYSKAVGITLFICYIPMTVGFTYADTFPEDGIGYHIAFSAASLGCAAVLIGILTKWLIPAFRNEPAITLDEKELNLRYKNTTIAWEDIDSFSCHNGRYGSVIGIKLKDVDSYIAKQPSRKGTRLLRFNKGFYGYHISVSPTLIKGDTTPLLNTLNDFFNRFRLGAPAFFHKSGDVVL